MVAFLTGASVFAQAPQPELDLFLRRQLAFSTFDLNNLQSGHTVVKMPKTAEVREVAVIAVTQVDVPLPFFEASVRDIVNFKKSESVVQIGRFSDPPKLEDLAGLVIDAVDIEGIRHCRVNNCELKMPSRFIEWFQSLVDWNHPDYRKRVGELTRQMLLSQVQEYLQGGIGALGQYNDKPYPLVRNDEFRSLLQPVSYFFRYFPAIQKCLQDYPLSQPEDVEHVLYWSKEKFGGKAVISLTHLSIHKLFRPGWTELLIASKGIYASHYFEASLGLTWLIPQQDGPDSRTNLIYVNRSRADPLRGVFGGLKRSLITGSVRDGARKNMDSLKQRLESQYRKTAF